MNTACTSQNADTCYVDVATDLGYDATAIESCFDENKFVFAAEDAELMALFGAQGSPAIYIEGVSYSGSRDANGILSAVCAEFEDAPEACGDTIESAVDASVPQGTC